MQYDYNQNRNIILDNLAILYYIIIEMRPKQWYKNFLIFLGIIFSVNIFNLGLWFNVLLAFLIFCIISGSIYIINDVFDAKNDSIHPIKSKRPIASGKLNANLALILAIIMIIAMMALSTQLGNYFTLILFLYIFITILYDIVLKKLYLVDIFSISIGMVLRAIAGCVAIAVMISPWLILCTFLMAMYLGIAKRRHELLLLGENAINHRQILKLYSVKTLDMFLNTSISALIVSYSLYTFFSGRIFMMLTIPFALYGVFKYTDQIYNNLNWCEPEMMFKDIGLMVDLILWLIIVLLVLLEVPDSIISLLG